MTFEYRDADGGHLSVTPLPGVPYVLVRTDPEGCAVPADLVPDAIAGIRDTTRQAVGQASTIEPDVTGTAVVTLATPCDNCDHALNWHSSQANCVVAFCGCGRFRPPARTASGQQPQCAPCGDTGACNGGPCAHPDAAPTVGQPAEAQATDEAQPPRIRWRVEHHDPLADEWIGGIPYQDRQKAVERLEHVRANPPVWAVTLEALQLRLVRETTTWTVEDAR